jgi:hypothetical protein
MPDIDLCSECLEHCGWEEDEESGELLSNCCDAPPLNTDPDVDMER